MDSDFFKRTLMETLIDRALTSYQQDPRRTVRNLVDLGKEASTGRFQAGFLGMAQQMLERQDSPYYEMVRNAVTHTDRQRIKTFGINFGWNCLTAGAHQIRTLEQERRHNIPWSLTLHMVDAPGGLTQDGYLSLIRQGNDLGIYAYFLFPDGSGNTVGSALALAQQAEGSVFFLFLPAGWDPAELSPPDNMMIGVSCDGEGWRAAAERLREKACLYGLYRTYSTSGEAEDIISGRWVEQALPYAGVGTMCLAGPGCPQALQDQVYQYVLDTRLGQRYPTLLVDFYRDVLYADVCISDGPCFVGILPGGGLTAFADGQEVPVGGSVRDTPLETLLTRFKKE